MNRMRRTTLSSAIALISGLAGVSGAQAASVYVLDRSDMLPDGVSYIQVTIADGADGAVDFTVQPLGPLLDRAGDSLEIRSFAFNIAPDLDVSAADITGLPDKWAARGTSRTDGFGRFDMTLYGTGPERIDSLTFSIIDVDGDSPASYANLSTGNAGEGHALFSARVRDLVAEPKCNPAGRCTTHAIPTAFVAGAVPLPAGGWLAGVAAAWMVPFFARRRRGSSSPPDDRA